MSTVSSIDRLAVSPSNPVPLYLQLSVNLRRQIADGHLSPGMSLPTVQTLARHCGMSQATVMRALSELASEGFIVTRRGARSVVAARQAASTEVLFGLSKDEPTPRENSFFNQLIEGLHEGYGDAERRFLATYLSANPADGAELVRVCQVAQADGIVAYRPRKLAIKALQEAAPQVPTVSLFHSIPGAPADSVLADPAPLMRRLLQERIAQGKRHFCYVGALDAFLQDYPDAPYSPYLCIHRTLIETVRAAGLDVVEYRLPKDGAHEEEWSQLGKSIPDGTVLVTGHPRLALVCEGKRPRLDKISYTEYRGSLELAANRVTTLYLGLETVGCAAAELLRSRVHSGNSLSPRVVRLAPTVMEARAGM